jgi:branched-chain amino acid transport system ATP-binding protein
MTDVAPTAAVADRQPEPATDALLRLDGFRTGYGPIEVVHGLDLAVARGDLLALLGANGAGKSTTMLGIAGINRAWGGSVWFGDEDVTRMPARERARRGISLVPEGRQLFPGLTVRENLEIASVALQRSVEEGLTVVLGLFPELERLLRSAAGSLSGGEQQMTAIARGIMTRPQLLMIDELSLGLAPVVVDRLVEALARIHDELGITVVFVEQDADLAMDVAARVVVLSRGVKAIDEPTAALAGRKEEVERVFLGLPVEAPAGG